METKPNSFLVGLVVLIILIAGTGFVIWFSKLEMGTDHNLYRIDFEGAVTGLRENEDVLYKGIAIGKVKKIRVFREDVNRVKVMVDIKRPDIIRESSIATIEAQGLTGVTFVQITGSDQNSPILKANEGEKYPVIKSKKSNVEALFTKAPQLLDNMTDVARQLEKLFDDQMVADTKAALSYLKMVTQELSEGANSINVVMKDVRTSLQGFQMASKRFEHILNENEPSLTLFMESGLPAITAMSQKIDSAADQVSDLAKMIRQSPLGTLTANPNQGYKVK